MSLFAKKNKLILLVIVLAALSFVFGLQTDSRPSQQTDAIEERIDQILKGMTLRQKVGQMVQADIRYVTPEDVRNYGLGSILNGGGAFPGNNRYATLEDWLKLADTFYYASLDKSQGSAGIPIIWGTDAVHGNNNVIGATVFPHNIGLGAANDPALVRAIGKVTALETLATGMDWVFAPTVAVVTDDRWGRTYESYSDRPQIVETLGRELVLGLQGTDEEFLSENHLLATAKHFIGDGGTHRGIDQGDNRSSKQQLLDVHGQGYLSAIDAGVQTVMASFNSWNGEKIHGRADVLTGILRDEMGFDGLLISDWNGHGQVEGCNNESCAQAINAGIDILMAPEDWKILIENSIQQVQKGEISEQRIDQAVRRILRVKARAGLFEKGPPSSRINLTSHQLFGGDTHRALAREAVRKSLVMLKNNQQLLPLTPKQNVLVTGSAADDIGQQSGGWTITWQGTGTSKEDFPGATSVFEGIESAVQQAGGSVFLGANGLYEEKPDVAIVIFGEQPYSEGQGDVSDLAPQRIQQKDLAILRRLKADGIPVVSVLITGRPLWVNAELNASDAFVVAWLPGSEGGGIADVLFRNANNEVQYDFTGRLSFDWPAAEVNPSDANLPVANHLFEYGYGLGYQDQVFLASKLNEEPLSVASTLDQVVFKSGDKGPWKPYIGDESFWATPVEGSISESAFGEISVRAVDRFVQEDSRQISWTGKGTRISQFYWQSEEFVDLSGLGENAGLSFVIKINQPPVGEVRLRMDCSYPCTGELSMTSAMESAVAGEWQRMNIPLSCLENAGAKLNRVNVPFLLTTDKPFSISLNEVSVLENLPAEGLRVCPSFN